MQELDMTVLNPEEIKKWCLSKGMPEYHATELARCIEVTQIMDEEIKDWKQ